MTEDHKFETSSRRDKSHVRISINITNNMLILKHYKICFKKIDKKKLEWLTCKFNFK